jgi:ribosomal protein S18 acetylase RimI-like enzyme
MTEQYTIHKASIKDVDSISHLFNEYRRFYKQKSNIKLSNKFLKDRILNNQSVIFYAIDSSLKICCGFVQLYYGFSSVQANSILILNDLFIDEKFRKQGIAKSLLNTAHNYAKSNKHCKIVLETSINNIDAQCLYENMGYKIDNSFLTYINERF